MYKVTYNTHPVANPEQSAVLMASWLDRQTVLLHRCHSLLLKWNCIKHASTTYKQLDHHHYPHPTGVPTPNKSRPPATKNNNLYLITSSCIWPLYGHAHWDPVPIQLVESSCRSYFRNFFSVFLFLFSVVHFLFVPLSVKLAIMILQVFK